MVTFSVSVWQPQGQATSQELRFSVPEAGVLLAGSRNREIAQVICRTLIQGLAEAGFGFLVGCAPGVDRSFRKALSVSPYTDRALVGCAFASRLHSVSSYGLSACLVVPERLSPKAALRRRTLWLVKRACLVILFPEDPTTGQWGRGSQLAYRAALDQLKPVFVACSEKPGNSEHYRVARSCLYGLQGYWVVPHPISEGGTCDDEF
jgi:hypothetical protein